MVEFIIVWTKHNLTSFNDFTIYTNNNKIKHKPRQLKRKKEKCQNKKRMVEFIIVLNILFSSAILKKVKFTLNIILMAVSKNFASRSF